MKQLNWYQIFGNAHKIPDGRTVEPTDDIQIWLNCANIWDKSYTTLAEVLADTDTLLALITSNNAVDYMVRSTTWAVPITVPKMTSNTTPSGVASCDKNYTSDPAWHAFDQDTSTRWSTYQESNPTSGKVRYQFTSPVAITSVTALIHYDGSYRAKDYKVNASNDGITYQTLASGTFTSKSAATTETITFQNTDKYLYWEMEIDSTYGGAVNIAELQFYSDSITTSATAMTYIGQNNYCANTLLADATWHNAICNSEYFESVLNVKAPKMTSATTPEGEVSARGSYGSQVPYMAFDNNTGTAWRSQSLSTSDHTTWIQFKFPSKHKIYRAYWSATHSTSEGNLPNASIKIQASNNNSTFVDIYSEALGSIYNKEFSFVFPCDTEYEYWRLWIDANVRNLQPSVYAMEVQFYGREDV